jgi:hypothetical protein
MRWDGTNEVPVAPKFGNRASPVNVQTRAHLANPKEGRGTDTETQPWHIPVYQRLLSFYHNIVSWDKKIAKIPHKFANLAIVHRLIF